MINEITDRVKHVTCNDWKNRITGKESICQMLQMFLDEPQMQEYCLTHNYPSIEQLKSIADEAEPMGIIINRNVMLDNPQHLFVFGDSVVKLKCDKGVAFITARHTSLIEVEKSEDAIVFVTLYDDAEVVSTRRRDNKLHIRKAKK